MCTTHLLIFLRLPLLLQVVREVRVEGGFRKPELKDLLILRALIAPYTLIVWLQKTYRRRFSKEVSARLYCQLCSV